MKDLVVNKSDRILHLYLELSKGKSVSKKKLAQQLHVTERSIQRDIVALRCFLTEHEVGKNVVYDRACGYRMVDNSHTTLSNSEVLAACKILLESRSMRRDEMLPILDKLIECCAEEDSKKAVHDLVANEAYHYLEPHHGKKVLDGLWEIGQAIQNQMAMEIEYERMKEPKLVTRRIQPVGLMFSEYYFYLAAFLEDKSHFENPDDSFPTIYRLDRVHSFQVLPERFAVPYKNRFEEGEFRKRVQFMYGGRLQVIRFRYTGPSLEAVLDRLPTAQVLESDDTGWTVRAEVFGKGIEMWLRSQGDYITILN